MVAPMRIRRKPWARPELAECPFFIDEPDTMPGKWSSAFVRSQPVWLELGCGKGAFLAQAAVVHPEINFIGVDIKSDMLGVARRRIVEAFSEQGREPDNILLFAHDIERIFLAMDERDTVDRIVINFCNPWPTGSDHKKRLTHPRQLEKYRVFLRDGGEIRFKTDDDRLFEESLRYFEQSGFSVTRISRDLHRESDIENFVTEHEAQFSSLGVPIKFLIAKKLPEGCVSFSG